MVPISINKFVNEKLGKDLNKKEIKINILAAAKRKKQGKGCPRCGAPIWAIGSGMIGSDMCFICATGEEDDSNDYELDKVCF